VDSRITVMPLEKYVAAVVAGEGGTLQSDEALRALAVAARTYAVHFRGRHENEGYDFCGATHCQRADPAAVTPRIEAAVAATAGELIWYHGAPALALYSRDCGGVTEAGEAPYLPSRPDPYCGRGAWRWSGAAREIASALSRSGLRVPRDLTGVAIVRKSGAGRVVEAALLGNGETVRVSAESLRLAVGRALGFATIRSDWWEARTSGGRIEFTGKGEGHGVGLCQYGADAMGAAGKSWREILAFYYPGTLVGRWTRLAGEAVALFTTAPENDGVILALAERFAREMKTRTGWPVPRAIELRVYPDLASFRDATAEPGWVAAHTSGTRIDLQPPALLRAKGALESTLRHEMAHVFVESQARPGIPVWFREGLAGYLSASDAQAGEVNAIDDRSDEKKARASSQASVARVRDLVKQSGLPTVLGWVHAGLPQ
jgi:stage II sporulation protein D